MKRIIGGVLVAPFALFFNNVGGIASAIESDAATKLVDSAGTSYQLYKTLAHLPDISTPLGAASIGLIAWGTISRVVKRRKAKAAASKAVAPQSVLSTESEQPSSVV